MNERNFWDDVRRMRRRMNRYFSYPEFPDRDADDFEDSDELLDYRKAWAEFSETEDDFVMNIEIPGVSKEDIKVNLTEHGIEIKAEKKLEKKQMSEDKESFSYVKSYSGFYRMINLPERADVENIRDIEAVYKDGVLKLLIPKKKSVKKEKKEIRVE